MTVDKVFGVYPRAHIVRAAAKRAGVEHVIESVRSGKHNTWVWVKMDAAPADKAKLAEALCPLWDDGDTRVMAMPVTGSIAITRYQAHDHPGIVAWHANSQHSTLVWTEEN